MSSIGDNNPPNRPGRKRGSGGHSKDEVPGDGVSAALEVTLASLDLRFESAAHVASMRLVAKRMDGTYDADTLSKLANTFMRQCTELREWVAPPSVEEDPWDVLSRALANGETSDE